jgi:hypothetical protein
MPTGNVPLIPPTPPTPHELAVIDEVRARTALWREIADAVKQIGAAVVENIGKDR